MRRKMGFYSLEFQLLPEKKKNEEWIKKNLDRLEEIGVQFRSLNKTEYGKYYDMLEGDYDINSTTSSGFYKELNRIREEADYSDNSFHFDFCDNVRRVIIGLYLRTKGTMTVSTVDDFSKNEFLAEKTSALNKYSEEVIEKTLQIGLIKNGISFEEDFESEEERQQYLNYIEEEKNKIISPEEREMDIVKNFKTVASEWGAFTLERDEKDFEIDSLISEEITDLLASGRFFRNHFVGSDYYQIEHWKSLDTFFDPSPSIKYPQYGEYAGRVVDMTVSDVILRYGNKMSHKQQKDLADRYVIGSKDERGTTSWFDTIYGRPYVVPYKGYFEDLDRIDMEKLTGMPWGKYILENEDGSTINVPTYINPYNNSLNTKYNRNDIPTRNDLVQVTEAYWRSYEEIAVVNFTNENNAPETRWVTGSLIDEFIKDFGLKKLRNVTIEEMIENPQSDTICYTFRPEIRYGVKIGTGSYKTNNSDSAIYIGGQALDNQIRKDSEQFNVCIPLTGLITSSTFKKMDKYIMLHNMAMNQAVNYMEKELGAFLLLDFKFLPSEFKDNEDSIQTLTMLYEAINSVGVVPIDTSKKNLQNDNPNSNYISQHNLDYSANIDNRIKLASIFKNNAFEQAFGINQGALGQPQMYMTAEGVKQGAEATFSQTEMFFNEIDSAYRKSAVVQLNVAQSCIKDGKDFKNFFIRNNRENAYIELNDDNFPLRMFDVHVTNTAKDKRNLEEIKRVITSNNTQEADMLDFAQVITSNSVPELMNYMAKSRDRQDIIRQENIKADREKQEQNNEFLNSIRMSDWEEKNKIQEGINETGLEKERIKTYGKMAEKQVTDRSYLDRVDRITEKALEEQNKQKDRELESKKISLEEVKEKNRFNESMKKLNVSLQDLKEKRNNRVSRDAIARLPRK